jgi:HEAT repeat protein
MSIIAQLASSLGRRDEVSNQELAKKIAENNDEGAVQELIENLQHKSAAIQNDCIKVLYEVGEQKPVLIAGYAPTFVELLSHKNNRLQWGAMTALYAIVKEYPKTIQENLVKIVAAADSGSVITKDYAVKILICLCAFKIYADDAFTLLNEQLLSSPTNQLPMYAELAIPVINDDNKGVFVKTLMSRLDNIEKDTKRKRVEKVIKKFSK